MPTKYSVITNMNTAIFNSKMIKTGVLTLVATLMLSGTKYDEQLSSTPTPTSYFDYTIQVSGSLNNSFTGMIDFETAVKTTSKGIPFSILELKLSGGEEVFYHSFEFLISREHKKEVLAPATFEITKNQSGLLNNFDGVFGFANINELGELPLFAKSGEIQIEHLDETTIKGSLDIKLNNAAGKYVHLKGDFRAKK
ncbi:hypothetical protein [Maribacter sp. 2308TA10-17]|uniref:hypothetical protein n=1 Tax=Maribacter sp. 2308TA10-17 TaxID=3386276 RepID=UPI0039BCC4B8